MFIHEKNQTVSHTNKPSFQPWQWWNKLYCQSCGTNLGLKYQLKFNRHSDERLVKISDQNTLGIRRSKSQTESEHDVSWYMKRHFQELDQDSKTFKNSSRTQKNTKFETRTQQELKLPIETQQRIKPINWNSRIQYRTGFLWKTKQEQ